MSCGNPALAWAMSGRLVTCRICSNTSKIPSTPRPQLEPITSTRRASRVTAAACGEVPSTVRPPSSKVIRAMTGRSENSRQAMTAARNSAMSRKVSRVIRSALAAAKARTCSPNTSTISSKEASPTGSRKRPVGPMEAATNPSVPTALRANSTERVLISVTRSARP